MPFPRISASHPDLAHDFAGPAGLAVLGGEASIDEAGSGSDALRLLPRTTYDFVIADSSLPDMSGLDVIRFVRSSNHFAGVALLVISTQSSERDRARCLSLGADEFLPKPFTPELLAAAVAKCLAIRRPSV